MGFFKKFKKSLKSQNKGNETENFKYLDKLIHRGVKEIVLESDIVLTGREKSKYKEGIKLDVDDIVIDGNGHTIDACGEARVFYCTGKNITIKNITLKNGFGHGGASTDDGKVLAGGAICNMGGELTVMGSSFVKNFSKYDAGAIYNMEGKLTIFESAFLQNTAKSSGGAIESIYGNLIIEKSAFDNNDAKDDAGAVGNNRSDVTISECTFTSNTSKADNWGGGQYVTL